jgi:hypothetical protein
MAKILVRRYGFKTKKEYREHVSKHETKKKYSKLPSRPKLAYEWDWINWGDFLGTNYYYFKKKNFLNYTDALKYMHTQNIKSTAEYREWNRSDKRPNFIPNDPRVIYNDEYKSSEWLGRDVNNKAEIRKKVKDLICIIQDTDDDLNVFQFVICSGIGDLIKINNKKNIKVVKSYEYVKCLIDRVHDIISNNSIDFDPMEKFTAINFNEIQYQLSTLLTQVSLEKGF